MLTETLKYILLLMNTDKFLQLIFMSFNLLKLFGFVNLTALLNLKFCL